MLLHRGRSDLLLLHLNSTISFATLVCGYLATDEQTSVGFNKKLLMKTRSRFELSATVKSETTAISQLTQRCYIEKRREATTIEEGRNVATLF